MSLLPAQTQREVKQVFLDGKKTFLRVRQNAAQLVKIPHTDTSNDINWTRS